MGNVGHEREHKNNSAEQISPSNYGSHGFRVYGMGGEQQTSHRFGTLRYALRNNAFYQFGEEGGSQYVQQNVGQMVIERVETTHQVIQPEGKHA